MRPGVPAEVVVVHRQALVKTGTRRLQKQVSCGGLSDPDDVRILDWKTDLN